MTLLIPKKMILEKIVPKEMSMFLSKKKKKKNGIDEEQMQMEF